MLEKATGGFSEEPRAETETTERTKEDNVLYTRHKGSMSLTSPADSQSREPRIEKDWSQNGGWKHTTSFHLFRVHGAGPCLLRNFAIRQACFTQRV